MDRKTTALALAVMAVVMVMVGIFGHSYWTVSEKGASGGIGVKEISACMGDECRSASLGDVLGNKEKAFVYAGTFTFYLGLLAALGGLLAAGLVFAQKRVGGPISPARLSLALFGLTAVGAILFFATAPSEVSKEASFGIGLPLTLAGAGCGVVGMLFLDQLNRAMPAAAPAPPPQAPPPPVA
jgi:hypothetical protein